MTIDHHPEIDAYARERRLAGDLLGWGVDNATHTVTFLVDRTRPEPTFPALLHGYRVQVIATGRPDLHSVEHAVSHHSEVEAYAWDRRMADEMLGFRIDDAAGTVTFTVADQDTAESYPAELHGYQVRVVVDTRARKQAS